jgi:hypothetical protein
MVVFAVVRHSAINAPIALNGLIDVREALFSFAPTVLFFDTGH